MPPSSETFPYPVVRSLIPFVVGDIEAAERRILVLMPYDGHPVGLMVITSVLRVERTDAILVFHLAEHQHSEGERPSLSMLQYIIDEERLQTPDGTECFCVINDRNNMLLDLLLIYGCRYPHITVDVIGSG